MDATMGSHIPLAAALLIIAALAFRELRNK
jgi:hypothetical protein